jgi:hypothetical protein
MLLLLTSTLGVVSFSTLALMVQNAPEGYESEDGFNVIRRHSQVKRHHKAAPVVGTPAARNA